MKVSFLHLLLNIFANIVIRLEFFSSRFPIFSSFSKGGCLIVTALNFLSKSPMKTIFYLLTLGVFSTLNAQVSLDPVFATQYDSVTIIYDATKGSKGLMNLSPTEVYMHTGVITNKSTSLTDWRNVQGVWGTDDAPRKMTYKGNNIYEKRIKIQTFYGLTSSDTVKRLAFVFRNVNGSKEGKTTDGQDIFVDLAQSGLQVKIQSPNSDPGIFRTSDSLNIEVLASQSSTISIYQNGTLINTNSGTQLRYALGKLSAGDYQFVAKATASGISSYDTLNMVVRPDGPNISSLPQGIEEGVNYLSDTSVILCLYAPSKQFVYVQGDFNSWKLQNGYLMNRTPEGTRWWIQINGLKKGESYAYIYNIDGNVKVADPFSELVLDPWNDGWIDKTNFPNLPAYPHGKTTGIVSVFTVGKTAYNWQNSSFKISNPSELNIYELHIRDFIAARNYTTLIDSLNYLKSLGVNAVQLMPISEFEGNNSWGYNASFHMAVDKYYGNENQLKEFIDVCHENGMAVILDVVLNHAFGQSSHCRMYWDASNNQPASNNPWLNQQAKHDFNVGYDYNHESSATKYYTDRVLKYWLTEFQFDGIRFDLSKGFTQKNTLGNTGAWGNYDASRIALWKRIRDQIRNYDQDAMLILEHFADNDEEKELSNMGFFLWGNANHDYNEATMGYNSDLTWGSNYKTRGWSNANVVSYMESHDEERLMYKNVNFGNSKGNYSTRDKTTALKRMEMACNIFFTVPGPKMIWQFGELGYDVNIDFNGRTGEKPVRWEYLQDKDRAHLRWIYRTFMNLRNDYNVFHTTDFYTELNGVVKKTWLQKDDHKIHALSNTNVDQTSTTVYLQESGTWYELFTGDSFTTSNSTFGITMEPGEYRLYSNKKLEIAPFEFKEEQNKADKIKRIEFNLYPNPAKEHLEINFSNDHDLSFIRILDLQGRTLQTYQTSNQKIRIPLNQISNGIYFVEVGNDFGKRAKRFVIAR